MERALKNKPLPSKDRTSLGQDIAVRRRSDVQTGTGASPVQTTRRQVTILAADAAGYCRLIALDEWATVCALIAAREVFRRRIAANGGVVVDTAGDFVLATFGSAQAALVAATAIQNELSEQSAHVAPTRRLRFRVGLHLGDVTAQSDGTIYGESVNVAARLQGLAEPGGIALSYPALAALKEPAEASFFDLGSQALRNIAEPVRAYRLTAPVPPEPRRSVTKWTAAAVFGSSPAAG